MGENKKIEVRYVTYYESRLYKWLGGTKILYKDRVTGEDRVVDLSPTGQQLSSISPEDKKES